MMFNNKVDIHKMLYDLFPEEFEQPSVSLKGHKYDTVLIDETEGFAD